jgi:glutathionyl-hydroquinone reductase
VCYVLRLLSVVLTRDCRFTVPFLWDTKEHTVVNNESSEIIRIFNSEFNELLPREKAEVDLYPANIAAEIDELNEWVYDGINSAFFSCDVWLFF